MLQIHENFQLKNFNTFGVEATARWFVEISHEDELTELFSDPKWHALPLLILGGGSNVLFTQDFDGLVLRINIRGIEHRIRHDEVFVEAGAGEVWNDLVKYCVDFGFAGMENLSLIPGSVGASPVQNIGAYGVELEQVFERCKAFHIPTGEFRIFEKKDCHFSYRESVFKQELKGQYIITSVVYRLSTIPNLNTSYGAIQTELFARGIERPTIKDISDVVSRIRVSKLPDPSTIGNSGSFFKNPIIDKNDFDQLCREFPEVVSYPAPNGRIKLAAGWLIEQCGFKGIQTGETGTWKNQALVLVNYGNATGREVFSFSEAIIEAVWQKFHVKLEREVNIV